MFAAQHLLNATLDICVKLSVYVNPSIACLSLHFNTKKKYFNRLRNIAKFTSIELIVVL